MTAIHLLLLIHGMWGNPEHLTELERIARETHREPSMDGTMLHVLVSESIKGGSTYDGVDWGGERVAKEVIDTVKELKDKGNRVVRLSVTGYSLGGLIARYCIGVLHQQNFFDDVEPVNFSTIATPNCGLPRYLSLFSAITSRLGPKLLSRTGEQFYCADKWSPKGRPLLVVMADPDHIFYQALAEFKHIRLYANAINDITVPYVTASVETSDPFADFERSGIKINIYDEYPCLIKSYSLPSVTPPKPPVPPALTADWFRSFKPSRPLLPPWMQLRFPLNLVLYMLLPVLVPIWLLSLLLYSIFASRSSRSRIKLLEQESHSGGRKTILGMMAELEMEMEEAVVELIDNPDAQSSAVYNSNALSKEHPIITENHKKIAKWLNMLPIKKELAYFPAVRNSHAMIVCRDVRRFEVHRVGEGVVRHWAMTFVL